MPYPFDQIFAADPNNPEMVARNAAVVVFEPGDEAKTPLRLTTLTGLPLANPVMVNNHGFGPAFISDLDQVAWEGGGLSALMVSYRGLKDEAVRAANAAEAPADEAVDRGIQRADIPSLAAQIVAADGTVVASATEAVGAAVERAGLVPSFPGETMTDIRGGMLDEQNRATWLTHDGTGGPTDYALSRLRMSHSHATQASGGYLDSDGKLTWLTHDESGGPTAYAAQRIREVVGGGGGAVSTIDRHALLENELRMHYGGTIRTNGAAPVVMIFDHGLNNFRDKILPLLTARGLPAVMALNGDMHKPGHVIEAESANVTWEEINAWGSNIEIANHGASHSTRVFTDEEIEAEVLGSLNTLRTKLPAKKILNWVQPSAKYPGFNDGATTANWTDTVAGRIIYENHAVSTGTMQSPTHPLFPRDGRILQGISGIWLDGPGSMTGAPGQVQAASTAGKGIILRHHPRHLDESGYANTAALTALLDFLKAEQDAGRVKVLNLSQWSIADTGR